MKTTIALMIALLGAQVMSAHASAEDTAALAHYPQPDQVRSDILAAAGNAEPEEVSGRQAGRLMMLHSALAHTWSSSGNVSQAPPPARKLLEAYSQAYRSIDEKERAEPYWREKCGYFANLFDTCRRKRFTYELQYFKTSAQAANDTAQLYFPSEYQDRFVDLTGVGGSRQRFADYQSERREAGRVDERRSFRKKLPALLGGLSLIPLCIGFALFGMARRIGTSLKRYEFDNTTAGGVLEFSSFEASQAHERKQALQKVIANIGYLVFVVGVLGLGGAVGVLIANSQ